MTIYLHFNAKPKTNLGKILSKNFLRDRLVKFAYKFAKLVIEINSKIFEPKIYNKIINDFIHGNRQYKVIDKEL